MTTDNVLLALIISTLNAGMTAIGQPIAIQQAFQPTQQGVPTQPALFVHKIADERIGFPARKDTWGQVTNATFTGHVAGTILTVTAIASGTIGVGQILAGTGIPANTLINTFGTGMGGIGTYNISASLTISSEAMTSVSPAEIHTETTQYATTFQLSALATQNPADIAANTASDWLNYAAYVLQSMGTVAAFEAQGVGVLYIKRIPNPYFRDDRDQNSASPSFDFALTHKQLIITTVPVLESQIINVYRV